MMDNDRSLPSARRSADAAAVAVPLQHCFAHTTEARLILTSQRVAGGTQAVRKNSLIAAAAMQRALEQTLH